MTDRRTSRRNAIEPGLLRDQQQHITADYHEP
jgi:hypothetical protein